MSMPPTVTGPRCKLCTILTSKKICGICKRELRGEPMSFVYDSLVYADAVADMYARKESKLFQVVR